MVRIRLAIAIAIVMALAACSDRADADEVLAPAPHWRKPSAAVLLDHGTKLAVANESTGTVSLLDVDSEKNAQQLESNPVLSEALVGGRLTSLVSADEADHLLATDFDRHRLILLRHNGETIDPVAEAKVADYPVQVVCCGERAWVTSLWSRALTYVEFDTAADTPALKNVGTVELPFPPRLMCLLPDESRLIVADAFGGKLAVVEVATRQVQSVRDLPGSNIRGMAFSKDGSSLAIAHQITNRLARTTNDDIHWGMLVQNVIRIVDVDAIINAEDVLYQHSRTVNLGQPGAGEADPAGLAALDNDEWLVAISGVDQVSITRTDSVIRERIPVGDRPLAVVLDESRDRAYVVNQLSDSISIVDIRKGELIATLSVGPTPQPTAVSRGERLFYDARLSHDRWLSCHSCHVEGHSTGQLVDTKSDGTFGTPKRILTLLGTRDANPWAWNGEFRELHQQVRQSIASSMQGREPAQTDLNDIVAFLHTLEPAPPRFAPVTDEDLQLVDRGRDVFQSAGCVRCHVPSLTFTSDSVYDVGYVDESGLKKFNPPSLRGVSQRDSLFHDGRVDSLEAVLTIENHQLSEPLNEPDLKALLQYLKTL